MGRLLLVSDRCASFGDLEYRPQTTREYPNPRACFASDVGVLGVPHRGRVRQCNHSCLVEKAFDGVEGVCAKIYDGRRHVVGRGCRVGAGIVWSESDRVEGQKDVWMREYIRIKRGE